jgi:hypothetical protein
MFLKVVYKIWTIDWETYKGKGTSFSLKYGPFPNEQQARWFWLNMKEMMNNSYDYAVIFDKRGLELYIDKSDQVQPF